MNTIRLDPFKYPGLQTATLTNNNRKEEHKNFKLIGQFLNGATDGYVDIYLDYEDVSNKTRKRLSGYKAPSTETIMNLDINLPQARTYLLKSAHFSGYLIADLGSPAPVTSVSGDDTPTIMSPAYAPKVLVEHNEYTGTYIGSAVNMGIPKGKLCSVFLSTYTGPTLEGPAVLTLEEAVDEEMTDATPVTLTSASDSTMPLSAIQAFTGVAYGSFVRTKQYVRATLTFVDGTNSMGTNVLAVEYPNA